MRNPVYKFLSVDRMVKQEYLHGDLPKTKTAYHNLLAIAIPSIIEMVFVSLIGSVDTVMVGRLGYEAIAAVGLALQPRLILLSIFMALSVGVTAIVARRKGQNLPEEANRTLRNALVLIMGLTVIITTAALLFSRDIMLISGAQPETMEMADTYFRIMAYFLPVNALTLCINAAQRGIGDTRIAMVANVTANIVNVFFNFLLIYGSWGFPRLGVAGAAWASGIGFCVGLFISIFSLLSYRHGNHFLHISFKDNWRPHRETLKSILVLGGNSVLEQMGQRLGIFFYTIVIANLGTAVFAAHQVGMQFLVFSFNFSTGLAAASTSLVGQMLGEKRPDLAIVYGKCSQRLALLMSIGLASALILFRGPLVGIFLNQNDPDNIISLGIAVELLLVVAMLQLPQTSAVVISGCLRGAGDNLYVAVAMIICVAVVRPVLCVLAVNVFHLGVLGAWAASVVDMALRLGFMFHRFSGAKWHNIKV